MSKIIICKNCKRRLPSKDFIYKNECIWCSNEYFELEQAKAER